jgi:putative CocE/NonD family hydrolase
MKSVKLITALFVCAATVIAIPASAQGLKGAGTEGRNWVFGAATPPVSAASYQVSKQADVPITVRDGTVLRADLYLPQRAGTNGRFPTLVSFEGYSKASINTAGDINDYVSRGYAVLDVDIRGIGNSQGEWHSYSPQSQEDHYDVIEWAAAQPWSTGKIGVVGISYGAIMTFLAASTFPPSVKMLIPHMGAGDNYRGVWFNGGIPPAEGRAAWHLLPIAAGVVPPQTTVDVIGYDEKLAALMEDFYVEALSHPTLDTWWTSRITLAPDHQAMAKAGLAILFSDGWQDYFLWPMQRVYRDFAPHAGSRARLIIGPWSHASNDGVLPYTYQEFAVLWCDRFLKGVNNGVDKLPKVLIYVQGPNQWRFEKDWPIPDARATRLYMHSVKSGTSSSANDGTLSVAAPTTGDAPATQAYIPAATATSGNGGAQPSGDQSAQETFASLTWTTAPLSSPTEVTGPIIVNFWASADATDTDFVVQITDVSSNETATTSTDVTRAWLRGSHRTSDSNPTPLVPGTPYLFSIEVWPTSYVFQPGHRIRLAIYGQDVPGRIPDANPAARTFYQDAAHPSYVELPVIGTATLP